MQTQAFCLKMLSTHLRSDLYNSAGKHASGLPSFSTKPREIRDGPLPFAFIYPAPTAGFQLSSAIHLTQLVFILTFNFPQHAVLDLRVKGSIEKSSMPINLPNFLV